MQIFCRQCGAEIKAEDINLDNMMAKCASCNAVFSFADMYEDITPKAGKRKAKTLDSVPMPPGITIQDDGFQLEITRKWFGCSTIGIGVFALIWNGMIWFMFIPAMGITGFGMFSLFLLPFIAVGIVILYMAIAGLLNTTVIKVDIENLSIQHGPVPYPGKVFASQDIEQLYTKQQVHHNKNSTSYSYELLAVTFEGKKQKLIGGLSDSDQALFMEQEIERFLGIEDRPVRGEYR